MTLPGVVVTSSAVLARTGPPTDTGVWGVTGLTERGPTGTAVPVRSLNEYVRRMGGRVIYGQLYDALETFFADGGGQAYVSRVVGPAATVGSVTLMDRAGVPVATLRIDALGAGAWSSSVLVSIANGSQPNTFTIIVEYPDAATEVERFADLANPAAAVNALSNSEYVRAVDLASATAAPNNNPAVVTDVAMSAGTDDRAAITDTQWTGALPAFTRDLGSMQVSAPGRSTTAALQAIIDHCNANRRTAILDGADNSAAGTLTALAAGLTADERAGLFAPWVNIPGLTSDTTRPVPPSAVVAGIIARNDRIFPAAIAAAGETGRSRYALGVRQTFTDAEREQLNDGGVNVLRDNQGAQVYGWRTTFNADPWRFLSQARARMLVESQAEAAADRFVFATIDGQGLVFAQLEGQLAGLLDRLQTAGVIYGSPEDRGWRVDVSSAVNTPATIAAGQIRANVYVRLSPVGELIRIEIVKIPIGQAA